MENADPSPTCLPRDFHPALTEERLRICARMLANARRDALAMASYAMGDDPWSVGCRAFTFGRHQLERAAASGEYSWLEVLDDSAHFVFVIGDNGNGVPVRFYRGAAEEPTERTLRRQELEVQQLSLALGETAAEGLAFRLAVETDGTGWVERVVFLALRGDDSGRVLLAGAAGAVGRSCRRRGAVAADRRRRLWRADRGRKQVSTPAAGPAPLPAGPDYTAAAVLAAVAGWWPRSESRWRRSNSKTKFEKA